jgi:hypothetical protein
MKKLNRRRFLVGLGGVTVGLPLLSKFATPEAFAAPGDLPTRLIVMSYGMGTVNTHWAPTGQGSAMALPYITAPLERFKDRCLFVSHCDQAVAWLNEKHAWGHPAKKEMALTGTLMQTAFRDGLRNHADNVISDGDGTESGLPNNASVDHVIGEHLRQPHHTSGSIDLAIAGHTNLVDKTPSNFSFEGPANPVTMEKNPYRAFQEIFSGLNLNPQAEQAMRRLRVRKKSVLDAVRVGFQDLRQGLDAADRAVLDDHADRIRQIELDQRRVMCAEPTGIPVDDLTAAPWDHVFQNMSMSELAGHQRNIMQHAMACDLAPVGRLEFMDQHGPYFGVASVDRAVQAWLAASNDVHGWHSMVHGDPSPVDGVRTRPENRDPGAYAPFLLDGYRFFIEQFAGVLEDLQGISEGPDGRTALDNTMVVLVTDYGNGGGHGPSEHNFLFGGNTGNARSGFHFHGNPQGRNTSDYHTNHILVSMLQMFDVRDASGQPYDDFGIQGFSQGGIPGIF